VHAEHFAAPRRHTVCLSSLCSTSAEDDCDGGTWIEYGRLLRASKRIHAESHSLFEACYVRRHRFYFDDVAALTTLYRRTRWRAMRGTLEYDVRMAITSDRALVDAHWGERGRDLICKLVGLVAVAVGFDSSPEGVQRFLEHIDIKLGQAPGILTRCLSSPLVIPCGKGLVTKFWYSEARLQSRTSKAIRATNLPSIFMEGDLGSLPFLEELVELVGQT